MKKVRKLRERREVARTDPQIVPAGKFKPVCLRLMDQVQQEGIEIVITKHNRPVAKLVPALDPDASPFIGRSAGVIEAAGSALLAPLGEDWEVDADL